MISSQTLRRLASFQKSVSKDGACDMVSLSVVFAWRTISSPLEHYMPVGRPDWQAGIQSAALGNLDRETIDAQGQRRICTRDRPRLRRGRGARPAAGPAHAVGSGGLRRRQSRHRAARVVDAGCAEILRSGRPLFQPAAAGAWIGTVLSQRTALLGLRAAGAGRSA